MKLMTLFPFIFFLSFCIVSLPCSCCVLCSWYLKETSKTMPAVGLPSIFFWLCFRVFAQCVFSGRVQMQRRRATDTKPICDTTCTTKIMTHSVRFLSFLTPPSFSQEAREGGSVGANPSRRRKTANMAPTRIMKLMTFFSFSPVAGGPGDVDAHPERRRKAAFKAYEERQIPLMREENKGLKLSQVSLCVCDISVCVCDIHSFRWVCKLLMCVTWRIRMCDMTCSCICGVDLSCVWCGSFVCVMWLIHMCHVTCSYVSRDLFICVTWRVHMCDVTHSYVWRDTFICVTWRTHMCDVKYSYLWRYSFICVTWRIHMCDVTQSYVWRD